MKTKVFATVVLSVFALHGFASDKKQSETSQEPSKAADVRPVMQQILIHIQALRPFMTSESKFVDPKNSETIKGHLADLSKLVKAAKHNETLKAPTMSISREVLDGHISETERIFRVGDKRYARWALNSTLSVCMSCHTQETQKNANPWKLTGFAEFGSTFDQAELLFTGRDYEAAIALYDRIIDEYPDNAAKLSDVETALERKVAYYSRVKRDFNQAIESMKRSQNNKRLPESSHRNLIAWEGLFRKQSKVILPDPKTANDGQIKAYVDKELKRGLWDALIEANNPRLVTNLTMSGILYEYLHHHPDTKIKPEILYWLALCDRKINNNFFYSLADIYLKECVHSFPESPVAKKCFKEYETHTILSYSGSAGVNVPEDVSAELRALKMKVNKGRP
ncbi:MAG TPA: tetratricopeptide repeat protein [Bdellovibrionales bacterium]|nr:tetratricopeptide repeat protein [Bdellovibrionales bacterium]